MSEPSKSYPVPKHFATWSNLNPVSYVSMYAASIEDPESFWGEQGQRLEWMKPYTKVKNCLLYTSPSPRDRQKSRMPSSA